MDHHNRHLVGAAWYHVLHVQLLDRNVTRSCSSYVYGVLRYILATYDEAPLRVENQRRLSLLKITNVLCYCSGRRSERRNSEQQCGRWTVADGPPS
jgi:hypothetical protein